MKTFRNLPQAQAAVFEQIAVNNDGGHNPNTIKALLRKGLIAQTEERSGPFVTFRYYVPIPIHMEWCRWCSEQPENAIED